VEQASCLFCSTRDEFSSCGTGILPVPKRLIKNASICQLNQTFPKILSQLSFV
jgi:hypothetical protein